MATQIENVVAFVTGGSSGIGKAVVEILISNGGKVVIADIDDSGEDVAKKLGGNAIFVRTDVTVEKDIEKALRLTFEKFGKLNVLVNCAAIAGGETIDKFFNNQQSSGDWRKYFEVNTYGTFNVIRLGADLMKKNEQDEDKHRGVIVNIGSIAGHGITNGYLAYSASKAAVISMIEPIARALAPSGIRVVTVSPGGCDTPMITNRIPIAAQNIFLRQTMTPERLGKPREIAHLIKCIIENPFINAQDMRIDAGYRPCNKKCYQVAK